MLQDQIIIPLTLPRMLKFDVDYDKFCTLFHPIPPALAKLNIS